MINQPAADKGADQQPSKRGKSSPDADAGRPILHPQRAVEQGEAAGDDQRGAHTLQDARGDEDSE